jgi:diguanylate cyclase (GGDEF)-like protein
VWRGEFINTRKDGINYTELATIAPIKQPDGSVSHYVAIKEDITERREAEARIRQLAYYDTLTGLPNRSLMWDRLRHAIAASERSGSSGMLLLLDLDHFKLLNDTQGHQAGDALLREVARRLRSALREEDTVARLGDDDFAIVVEGLGDDRDEAITRAEKIAEHLHRCVSAPCELGLASGAHHVGASLGLTLFRGRTTTADAVLKQAEVAVARAKDDGRNLIRFFSEAMQAVVAARAELELKLRAALAGNGFRLYYQPQLDRNGQVIGAEALIRCFDAEGTMISPADFIPLAEETGLIVPIGEWVLEAACAQLRAWQREPASAGLSLSINVSARQFHQPDFVGKVAAAIERSRIRPGGLKIELTESVVIGDIETTVLRMGQIKALGVKFALDDFGTGYSSLSYLKRLPFDQLKIDQVFVRDMERDTSSEAIVRAILAISRSLELEVVAEGIETPAQHELLLTSRRGPPANLSQGRGGELGAEADEQPADACRGAPGGAPMAAELRGQASASKDQRGQIQHTADLHDDAEDDEGQRRVGVGRIDELDEEGHEEQDRLRVHQADQQRGTKRVRRTAHRRHVRPAVADLRGGLVPAPPGRQSGA